MSAAKKSYGPYGRRRVAYVDKVKVKILPSSNIGTLDYETKDGRKGWINNWGGTTNPRVTFKAPAKGHL